MIMCSVENSNDHELPLISPNKPSVRPSGEKPIASPLNLPVSSGTRPSRMIKPPSKYDDFVMT